MAGSTVITVCSRASTQLVVGQLVRVISKVCGDDGTQGAHDTQRADGRGKSSSRLASDESALEEDERDGQQHDGHGQ